MFWLALAMLIVGLIALVWSADRFLEGAAITAKDLGVSKMVIGLTVISLGTSAPEILVAVSASLNNSCAPDPNGSTNCAVLAIGNAIGSNIVNIGLVLGATAIMRPLPFGPATLRSELPWLMGATAIAIMCLYDLRLGWLDGLVLLVTLGIAIWRVLVVQRDQPGLPEETLDQLDQLPEIPLGRAIWWLASGLVLLLLSAHVLVWAATTIAVEMHVDELIIGLTVVAIGTSLPELAATMGAAAKGHSDMAIGNVVGSNILNILAVMAVPGLIVTTDLNSAVLWRDSGTMLALTLLLVLFAYGINSKAVITRFEGLILTLTWLGYSIILYIQAAPHV